MVLTIAVGVAGVGVVGQAMVILGRAMADSQTSAQPAQITIMTAPFVDDRHAVLESLRGLPMVEKAEALSYYRLRINASDNGNGQPAEGKWQSFEWFAIPDFQNKEVDRINREGVPDHWPPQAGELLLERLAAKQLSVKLHDTVWIETPDSKQHRFTVNGTVRNPGRESATLSGIGSGFVSMETLQSAGLPAGYNTVTLRIAGDGTQEKTIRAVAADARELLRSHSVQVLSTWIPEPGKHWASDIVNSMGSILQSLGALALIAASFLVVNTMLAILSSQLRQIGVMQVLGADPDSLVRMYLAQAGILGLCSLAVGLPAGAAGARALTAQSNTLLNFTSGGYELSYTVIALQVAIGIGVPLLAAYWPVHRGTRISIRDAIGGPSAAGAGRSRFDRLMDRVRGLPRPLLLSLRNTFRQKGRLFLTLATLGLGGAIVVSVFSVHASLMNTLDQSMQYTQYDVRVATAEPAANAQLEEIARNVPGVADTELWGQLQAYRVMPDGTESSQMTVEALPADSKFIRPHMLEGEWLSPGDEEGLVVDSYLLRKHPGLQIGDSVTLSIDGRKTEWRVKGFARKTVGFPVSYMTKEGLRRATGDSDRSSLLHLSLEVHDEASQSKAEGELKTRLMEAGLEVSYSELTHEMRAVHEARMNIVVVFLSAMAVLLSAVSALGLTGTMSLNVMERTREFGILRCIGAGDKAVIGIVVAEGAFLGVLGWSAGCLAAWPVTLWMCHAVGISLYQAPLDAIYSWTGVFFWLGSAVVLASLASLAPAWNAIRLSVREVLAYE